MGDRSRDELAEERIRFERARSEFRMELTSDKERMRWQFDDFGEALLRVDATENDARGFILSFELVIEFIAMAMALFDVRLAIAAIGQRPFFNVAIVEA